MSRKTQVKKQTILKPTTLKPTTLKPTTLKPTTLKPTTLKPTTLKPTTLKPTTLKPTTLKPTIVKPLRTVPFENGFHFYKTIGKYTGITATNLSEFAKKLQTIPTESIKFHFQRKDFQNWIKYTLKDAALAERISRLKEKQSTEDLRKEILRTVEAVLLHS